MGKKRNTVFSVIFGFLFLPLAFPGTFPEEAKSYSLPEQIFRYYDGYSFVSSFSTKQERSRLRACFKGKEWLGVQPGCTRLKNILDRMRKLQVLVQSIDPKMVLPPQPVVYIDYAGVVEIKNVAVSGDRATVRVTIHGLEPEATAWLIARYEEVRGDEQKLPPPEERLDLAKASTFRRQETHVWTRFKSGWRKSEANLVLLKN